MPSVITPNMSLIQPTIGAESGPTWALDINSSLSTIDGHDHSVGRGVQIGVAGLNIQSDLPLNSNNLTSIRSTRFSALSLASLTASDVGSLFFSGVDLYARDVNGNTIRLTQSGGIVGTAGSISGLNSPASASYIAGSQTFIWQSAVSTSANMDMGSIILRNITASSNGITIAPPAGLGASYTLTLPTAQAATANSLTLTSAAGAQSFLSMGSAYQLAQVNAAGTALGYVSQVQRSNLPTVGQQTASGAGSTSSTSFVAVAGLTVSLTTTGRPVLLLIQSDGSGFPAFVDTPSASFKVRILRGGVEVGQWQFGSGTTFDTALSLTMLDTPAAGTYTYAVQLASNSGSVTVNIYAAKLVAYEL